MEDPFGDYVEEHWDHDYQIAHIHPAPMLIALKTDYPRQVRDELSRVFALYWTDHKACLNALRIVLEVMLDEINVPRFVPTKNRSNNRQRRLSLQERIASLRDRHPDSVCHVEAAKWLGNDGSHGELVHTGMVLDALDQTQWVLDQLFDKTADRLRAKAARINSRYSTPEE